jgi:hypothetical protein
MNTAIKNRLEFIETCLYWNGCINRKDLTDSFGISLPQASMDIKKYQEIATDNIQYDKRKKCYFALPNFKPVISFPKADDYFSQLIPDSSEQKTFIDEIPEFDITPFPIHSVKSEILREIIRVIKKKASIHIEYQSMSEPDPSQFWIAPHAFAFDGNRWHARAYCFKSKGFCDFNISRILRINRDNPHKIDFSTDIYWYTYLTAVIAPHPSLSNGQKKVIEREYGMKNSVVVRRIRASLFFYLKNRLGFNSENQQIILLNHDEVNEALENLNHKF